MLTAGRSPRRARDRARIVCCHCHARKVKCDLQTQSEGTCSKCYEYGLTCQPRPSRRTTVKEKYARQAPSSAISDRTTHQGFNGPATPKSSAAREQQDQVPAAPASEALHRQYICSDILRDAPTIPPNYVQVTAISGSRNKEILAILNTMPSPSAILLNAYIDAYFQHIFHRFPIINHADLSSSSCSVALQQAICMVGTMLRRPKGPDSLAENEQYYYHAKILIHLNQEQAPLTVLKVVCLLSARNIGGPVVWTIDCAWYWLGTAIRLLHQTGLHREEICVALDNHGVARRIAWCIFIQDKLLSAALGRPTYIKDHEFDVRPLREEDFESPGIQSLLFIELSRIAQILGRILDLRWRSTQYIETEHISILHSLEDWIHNLPAAVRIFDASGSRRYRHDVFELHIIYFAAIILYFNLFNDQDVTSAPNLVSLVASSCMACLYNEIDCRDDLNYLLGIHSWIFTVAAMPQLLYNASECSPELENYCSEEIGMLVSALEQFQERIPGATVVLNTINRLRTSPSRGRSRNSTTARGSQEKVTFSKSYDISSLRALFPFPNSLSLRLSLLEHDFGHMVQGLVTPTVGPEDFSWIFEQFPDLSHFPFADVQFSDPTQFPFPNVPPDLP